MDTRAGRLLLIGSSAFKADVLPPEVKERIDVAIDARMTIIVGEARGACRRYQDYLASVGYRDVVVGHAKSIRYNAGNWETHQYGTDLKSRERGMIEDCDSAIIIWVNQSSVIAENLEYLKKLGKLTFIYEYSSEEGSSRFGLLDPNRIYRRFDPGKMYYRKK